MAETAQGLFGKPPMVDYSVIVSQETLRRVEVYRQDLAGGRETAGALLRNRLRKINAGDLDTEKFLELLLNTKQPQIFAESAVDGDGSDWTQRELELLGDVSVGMGVKIFDDGAHQNPQIHDTPFDGFLVYTPGALLRKDRGGTPADWAEVHGGKGFDPAAYTALYRRRLGPVFDWIEKTASSRRKPALVTIPGMGCGQFAGKYIGAMGGKLEPALAQILDEKAAELSSIKTVWYDPYNECEPAKRNFGNLMMLTRPLQKDRFPRPQLTHPSLFGFEDCELYSIVAWDHVSWPGNDYYKGSRATDDGVKAAATDTMRIMTGVTGQYDPSTAKYMPPAKYSNWDEITRKAGVKLKAAGRLFVS